MATSEVREPVVAGQFYPAAPDGIRRAVEQYTARYAPPDDLGAVLGGVVPHAGWVFSGPTAAKVFKTLSECSAPETVVLLGAVHRWGVSQPTLYAKGAWRTPLGEVAVDEDLAKALIEAGGDLLAVSPEAHAGEHSIEVQLPFVQVLFPEARILPIAVPPGETAAALGQQLAALAGSGKGVTFVASTDLTHYGMGYGAPEHGPFPEARDWMRQNDKRMLDLVTELKPDQICDEAARHQNACGPGGLAAVTAVSRELGARGGRLLEYTTSADVLDEPHADRAVGYAGIVFER